MVDDNPVLVSVLAEILKEPGREVRCASDGFAALAQIRARVPDILVSDLNMPGMSGFELLSVVQRRFPAIAVIAMSGSYSGSQVPDGVAADAFCAKGAGSVERLVEIVSTLESQNGSLLARPGTRQGLVAAAPRASRETECSDPTIEDATLH